jgi:hypothetical protein
MSLVIHHHTPWWPTPIGVSWSRSPKTDKQIRETMREKRTQREGPTKEKTKGGGFNDITMTEYDREE